MLQLSEMSDQLAWETCRLSWELEGWGTPWDKHGEFLECSLYFKSATLVTSHFSFPQRYIWVFWNKNSISILISNMYKLLPYVICVLPYVSVAIWLANSPRNTWLFQMLSSHIEVGLHLWLLWCEYVDKHMDEVEHRKTGLPLTVSSLKIGYTLLIFNSLKFILKYWMHLLY